MTHGLWPRGLGTAVLHNMNLLLTFFNWGFFCTLKKFWSCNQFWLLTCFLRLGLIYSHLKSNGLLKKKKRRRRNRQSSCKKAAQTLCLNCMRTNRAYVSSQPSKTYVCVCQKRLLNQDIIVIYDCLIALEKKKKISKICVDVYSNMRHNLSQGNSVKTTFLQLVSTLVFCSNRAWGRT